MKDVETMNDLSKHIANLSPEKRELLLQRLQKRMAEQQVQQQQSGIAQQQIVPQARDENGIALSFAQERLWFLQQLEPSSFAYNEPAALRLHGPFQMSAFERSVHALCQRHEILRTTFVERDGSPFQVVAASSAIQVPVIDLRALMSHAREHIIQQLTQQAVQSPFDLASGPLLRITVLRLHEQEHILLLTMHHIISDGWSMSVLIRELSALYQATVTNVSVTLPTLPIQYADYALWQRARLQGELLEEQLGYWRTQLSGAAPLLELPTDRPRPKVQNIVGARQSLLLPPELLQQLTALSQREGATLFMTLLAAFQVLLMRYSGQEDIVVGTPIAHRTYSELESLIGFFVNTLVLRTDLSGNPSFQQVLARVREITLGAYAHQDLPFERLVEEVAHERTLSYTPLFQVMFVLQNAPQEELKLGDLSWQPIRNKKAGAKFDLTFELEETAQGLRTTIEYNTDLFDGTTIERMLEHWRILLQGIVNDATQTLAALPLLTSQEQQQVLVDWQSTAMTTDEPEHLLHELIEAQVARTPDAVALVFAEQQMSYQELNRRANQLAHRLCHEELVGADVFVGVCMERSLELVVAVLAVLKAGGAYVPLDPTYPQDRLMYMIEDAQVPLVLTQTHVRSRIAATGVRTLCLDDVEQHVAVGQDEGNLKTPLQMEHQAYLIYTSGSTGKPKGAMNTHRNITNQLRWRQRMIGQTMTQDRILHKTTFSFDGSVWELFLPLVSGACLVLAHPEGHRDASYLTTVMIEQAITIVHFVPAMLQVLLQQTDLENCRSLRWVESAGEALAPELQERFFERFPARARLYNAYGPTEATINVTVWECQRGGEQRTVPIGYPIANTQVYILDTHLQLVPIGVAGELYIGGVNIARGYHRRADQTAERFLPHPFSTQAGARLYKTGDLGRYRADGAIEYIGRIDHQVKLRGFRIELGEIETTLHQQTGVQDAVVMLQKRAGNGIEPRIAERGYLVAYLVPQKGVELRISEIEAALSTQLPEYMVPHLYLQLDSLPVSSNGKLDRRALPLPSLEQQQSREFVAPQTPIAQRLAQIWQSVLGVEQIGIHDNFFALGGDSIISLQVVARARQAGLHFTPRHLFQYQTIAQLTTILTTSVTNTRNELDEVAGPIPLIPIQHWFFGRELEQSHYYNQAVLLQIPAYWSYSLLQQAITLVVSHHAALRLRFVQTAEGWLQQEPSGGANEEDLTFTQVDLRTLAGQEQQQALAQVCRQTQSSLNFTHGPIFRAVAVTLGDHIPARLFLVIHHLLVDGVSWRILLEDLQVAMQALLDKQSVVLPPATSSFADWARHLQQQANATWLQDEIPYWQQVAQVMTPPLPLDGPVAQPIPQPEATTRLVQTTLSAHDTRQLLHEATRPYHSQIQELLLAAVLHSLSAWMQSQHLRLDLEGHGREEIGEQELDITRTVGWFTSLFPALFTLPNKDVSWQDWIIQSKEQLRAIPHKGFGYGLLRYLHPDAEVRAMLQSAQPAPISFNYLGQFDQVMRTPAQSGDVHQEQVQFAPEDSGANSGALNGRSHLLAIDGLIVDGQLRLNWSYSAQHFQDETITRLAQQVQHDLQAVLTHCLSSVAGRYTPSDFPLARLDQSNLDRILADHADDIEDLYPLTSLQQGLLFHSVSAPQSGIYVEQFWCVINELDPVSFVQAWEAMIARNPILRTSFVWEGLAQPLQQVWKQVALPVHMEDWRSTTLEQQRQTLAEYLHADRQQGFDLQQSPLLRLSLLRLDEQRTQVVWTHHHLLLDGWSMTMLLQEIFTLYQQIRQGKALLLEQRRPYRDYLLWLQEEQQEVETYWRTYLRGVDAPTPSGMEQHLAPAAKLAAEPRYTSAQSTLSHEISQRLQSSLRRQHITLNTLLQGAWSLVLACYSGQEEVLFGSVVAGRPPQMPGIERMLGLFINTLPVRIRLQADWSIQAWLQGIQAQQIEQQQYARTPLTTIKQYSEIPGSAPFFESVLVVENYPVEAGLNEAITQLQISDVQIHEQTNYPLTIIVAPSDRLLVKVYYDETRFAAVAVQRLLQHLFTVLEQLLEQPEQLVRDITLLNAEERMQLLQAWNQETVGDRSSDGTLSQLIERQVERTPDTVALVFEEQHLTYRELNTRANRLAHILQRSGVGPDVLVGVCLERSVELVMVVLAILKAGGAYMPLDPGYPAERLSYMLADAQPVLLLTQRSLLAQLPATPLPLLCLDQLWEMMYGEPERVVVSSLSPKNLAYVIYTSGSTGRPKGAMLSHQALLNLFTWQVQENPLPVGTRVLQFAPLSFDVSCQELFTTLQSGGTLVVLPGDELRRDPAAVLSLLAYQRIERIFVPYVVLQQLALAAEQQPALKLALHSIVTAGEQLQITPSIASWMQHLPECTLSNQYGPSESHVVTSHLLQGDPGQWPLLSPIGKPINNTQIYVLDASLRPVPVGISGELYIGGIGLARGYHQRPDLTAERFIPHPFSQKPGQRLYRTGDLARYRADGVLEFLGRSDFQVKLRGFRIELEEIEDCLRQQTGVQDAVVQLQKASGEGAGAHAFLVAYLVPQEGATFKFEEIEAGLGTQLPDYMVPHSFMQLEALPLTPSGKLDRRALPLPTGQAVLRHQEQFVPPSTAMQIALADIWRELFQVSQIGIHDNFFALGGHSLLLFQLLNQIQQRLGQAVPLSVLFQAPTIAQQAEYLWQQSEQPPLFSSPSSLVLLQSAGDKTPFFLLHPVSGFVYSYYPLVERLAHDRPFYGLQSHGLSEGQTLLRSMEEMVTTYLAEIRAVQPEGPYFLGGYSLGGLIAYEMARQLQAQGQDVASLVVIDAYPPVVRAEEEQQQQGEPDYQQLLMGMIAFLDREKKTSICREELYGLPPEGQRLLVLEQLKAVNRLPQQLNEAQFQRMMEVLRANTISMQMYQPGCYAGPMLLLCGEETPQELVASWNRFVSHEIEKNTIPGGHMEMMSEPNVTSVAVAVQQCLNEAQQMIDDKKKE